MACGLPKTEIRRAVYAVVAVALAELVGTIGFHVIEGARWIDAFYFESMLATGQGPPFPLTTDAGKIFASIMAYVSVGSVLSAVILTVGPVMVRLWHEAASAAEAEARRLEHEALHHARAFEEELRAKKERDRAPPSGPVL
jgi:hypothetical protein